MIELNKYKNKYKEAVTAEFYGLTPKTLKVIYNNSPMLFSDFLCQSKYDTEARKVLQAIKLKMEQMNYNHGKTMIDFLIDYFNEKNISLDVFIRDNGKVSFDDKEISQY